MNTVFSALSEFGLSYVPHGLGRLSIEESAAAFFKPVLDQWRSTNVSCPTAAGSTLTWVRTPSTPPPNAVALMSCSRERAGELLFADPGAYRPQAPARQFGSPLDGELYLFKNKWIRWATPTVAARTT